MNKFKSIEIVKQDANSIRFSMTCTSSGVDFWCNVEPWSFEYLDGTFRAASVAAAHMLIECKAHYDSLQEN
jgi:hypothetical protein